MVTWILTCACVCVCECRVNDATTAMAGRAYCEVPPIYDYAPGPSLGVGVCMAEEGTIHALCNVQHSRALPFHYDDREGENQQACSESPVEEDEVSVFETDEEGATVFGDPKTEEWDGEYDETETF